MAEERSGLCPRLLGDDLQTLGMSCLVRVVCLPGGPGPHSRSPNTVVYGGRFLWAMGDQLDLQRGCRLRSALSTQPGLHETDPIKTLGTKAQERFSRQQNFMCVLSTLLPGKVHDSRWERTSRCIVLGSAWALPHTPPPLAVCFNFFFFLMFIYWGGRGRERGRHRIQSRLPAPELPAQSPTRGWNSRTARS